MTGRDLIIYILENNLEDELVCEDGRILGFMTEIEAAIKFGVGVATVEAWIREGMLKAIKIGGMYYIPSNSKYPDNSEQLTIEDMLGSEAKDVK